jgi:hypothetical protein
MPWINAGRTALVAGLSVFLNIANMMAAEADRIVVDVGKGVVSPNPPVVNPVWATAIAVEIRYNDKAPSSAGVASDRATWVPRLRFADGIYYADPHGALTLASYDESTIPAGSVSLRFYSCGDLRKHYPSSAVTIQCPIIVGNRNAPDKNMRGPVAVYVPSGQGDIAFAAELVNGTSVESTAFSVHLLPLVHALVWTGGFAISDLRDERYDLVITDEANKEQEFRS